MNTFNSKLIFVALQLADLLTTLLCFHVGLTEMSPITARLIAVFGLVTGLVITKLLACAAVLPMKRLVWVGNALYVLVVGWNLFLATVFGFTRVLGFMSVLHL